MKKIYSADWNDYELIDAGKEKKLERWGNVITIRPEIQAYFKSGKSHTEWREIAHFEFIPNGKHSGKWISLQSSATSWEITYDSLTFILNLTQFKHIGLFPEQRTNWDYLYNMLSSSKKILNLFAYTGAASIIGKNTGANVTHVDSVKQLITWAKKNMEASNLSNIRWICDDALKFAQKEIKRKNLYDVIVMDPPAWGIGANKERWKIEHQLPILLQTVAKLLPKDGLLIVNTYSPKMKLEQIDLLSQPLFRKVDSFELWKKTTTGKELFYGNLLRCQK